MKFDEFFGDGKTEACSFVLSGVVAGSLLEWIGDQLKFVCRDANAGIMDLEQEFTPGTPVEEALKLTDTVFEVDLTPNRPDCLSVIGVAREVAAFTTPLQKVKLPDFTLPHDKVGNESIHDYAKVEILDPDLCPRYSAGLGQRISPQLKMNPWPFSVSSPTFQRLWSGAGR